jgi:hypothetical protein
VWDLACRPLAGEEGLKLVRCAAVVHVREAERDERGVPTPLVRIKGRGWFGPGFQAVAAQDVRREGVDAVEAAGPWPFRKALWKLFLSHEPVLVTPVDWVYPVNVYKDRPLPSSLPGSGPAQSSRSSGFEISSS